MLDSEVVVFVRAKVHGFLHLVGSILVSLHGLLHFCVSDQAELLSVLEGNRDRLLGSEPSEVGSAGEGDGCFVELIGHNSLSVETLDDAIGLNDVSRLGFASGHDFLFSGVEGLLGFGDSNSLALSPPCLGLLEDILSLGDSAIGVFAVLGGACKDLHLCVVLGQVGEVVHGFLSASTEDGDVLLSSQIGLASPSVVMHFGFQTLFEGQDSDLDGSLAGLIS